ncbi:Fic family protein [Acetobacteraceae bacterium]|nr:Fic family protein [Acetobacteraceae bacterium]
MVLSSFDTSDAVSYHYDGFPPPSLKLELFYQSLLEATEAVARYDQALKNLPNSEILLAPLRSQEAVVSSRIEGTIATLEELVRYEAEQEDEDQPDLSHARNDVLEVALYAQSLRRAQEKLRENVPLSPYTVREIHANLLRFGRGHEKTPGQFKTEQNYIGERLGRKISFIPISPEQLPPAMDRLFDYLNQPDLLALVKITVAHLEFEALHPFKDGNGRVGRMLIPLLLWKEKIITQPHFYISAYFEQHKEEYLERMRAVSREGAWEKWLSFFLNGMAVQARHNLKKAEEMAALYESYKLKFRQVLNSAQGTEMLDFLFTRPIFQGKQAAGKFGISTSNRFRTKLLEAGILSEIKPPAGRRSGIYRFDALLALASSEKL